MKPIDLGLKFEAKVVEQKVIAPISVVKTEPVVSKAAVEEQGGNGVQ